MHVIITGAAGMLGRCAVEGLGERHTLTLLDRRPHPSRPTVLVDLADIVALRAALPATADVLIHLGAIPKETHYEEIVRNNVLATAHVFDEARARGIRRVVFASTVQVYGDLVGRQDLYPLRPERDAAPNSHYALSKYHGELLGAMMARKHGMSVIALRLGFFVRPEHKPAPPASAPPLTLGIRDALHLFQRCVEATHAGYCVITGVSRGGEAMFDLNAGRQAIGFDPQDSAEEAMRQHWLALGLLPATGAAASP